MGECLILGILEKGTPLTISRIERRISLEYDEYHFYVTLPEEHPLGETELDAFWLVERTFPPKQLAREFVIPPKAKAP